MMSNLNGKNSLSKKLLSFKIRTSVIIKTNKMTPAGLILKSYILSYSHKRYFTTSGDIMLMYNCLLPLYP